LRKLRAGSLTASVYHNRRTLVQEAAFVEKLVDARHQTV
jgi:hypothetical protein